MAFSFPKSISAVANQASATLNRVSANASNFINSATKELSSGKFNSQLLGNQLSGALSNIGNDLSNQLKSTVTGKINNLLPGNLGNLVANATELQGLFDTPLRIVEKGAAELFGLLGEEFSEVTQLYRDRSNTSAFDDWLEPGAFSLPSSSIIGAASRSGQSSSKIPNPLRDHASFNYNITLGVLSAEEYNNPAVYRAAGGFKNYIIRSGGGNYGKRYQVADELAGSEPGHAEYFIDDLDIDAIISPNKNTGVTLGSNVSFRVIEPFSMGNFIQAVIGAAADAGFNSYTEAPYCLRIDFVGWNEGGQTNANFIRRPIFIPIKFINMEFGVTASGSEYLVKAIPMSESGLADNVNKLKTPIKATGTIVHEVLETSVSSLTSGINAQLETLEDFGALAPYDRYIIAFPKTKTALVEALEGGVINEEALTAEADQELITQKGARKSGEVYDFGTTVQEVVVKPTFATYAVLKSFSENTNLMNEIGLSAINIDTNTGGNATEAEPIAVIDPRTGKVDPAAQASQQTEKARDYQFSQRERITKAIEKVVLESQYAAEKSTEGSRNGLNKWFRIDTQVFIEPNPGTEAQTGRPPKVYVYSVLPYEVDEAATAGSSQRSSNTQGLKNAAVKEYNYIYTGKNEDILDFNINFNNAFLTTALSNFGMNSGAQAAGVDGQKTATAGDNAAQGATAETNTDNAAKNEAGGTLDFKTDIDVATASRSQDIRIRIAEQFHDRITNLPIDMVSAEMEIFGDPYFLPQETGNYAARTANSPMITVDGTMSYQQSQVFVVVNFLTPFDYQIKGATMEMPSVVPGFSGLYAVWGVNNNFSGGKYTSRLKMTRRRGQDDPATTNTSSFLKVDNNLSIREQVRSSGGTVGSGSSNQTATQAANNLSSALQGAAGQLQSVLKDDIKNLLPAVDQIIPQLTNIPLPNIKIDIPGIDINLAKVPNLTQINAQVAQATQQLQGALSSGQLQSQLTQATSQLQGALSSGEIQTQLSQAQAQLNSTAAQVSTQIDSFTKTATSKINSLLG